MASVRYEIRRREIPHSSGVTTVFYEVVAVAPNGAESPRRDRSYQTREDAQSWIDSQTQG